VPLALLALLVMLLVPLAEIYLLIEVGSWVGALPTLLLCLVTAVLGVELVRRQGFSLLARINRSFERREPLAADLLDGALLLAAGVFLLIPGFATDTLGFLLLIPPLRCALVQVVLRRLVVQEVGVRAASERAASPRVIEGEFRREDD